MHHVLTKPLAILTAVVTLQVSLFAADPIPLWPKGAPGEKGDIGGEKDMTKPTENKVGGRSLIRLGNVSNPTLTFFPAPKDKNTGTTVLVCPGGGYNILAYDLEGTEVCEMLNSIGVNGVLLKYRVPRRKDLEKHAAPLQDVQRAMGMIREKAKEWGINPKAVGILGFSAGGHLAAVASNNTESRTYPVVDGADSLSCRPDFSVLIYPAYLTVKEQGDKISPEIPITTNTPPTFIVMAEDDPIRVENALFYYNALKQVKVPAEMHLYPTGGHGYGLRPSQHVVTTWPARLAEWMKSRELLGTGSK